MSLWAVEAVTMKTTTDRPSNSPIHVKRGHEAEQAAAGFVDGFLNELSKSVRGKTKQYDRMISVLWHCYLVSNGGTQLEIAEMLGVSDSLVSDYRKRIESNLQQLTFSGINEARQFERALKSRVRSILAAVDQTVAV